MTACVFWTRDGAETRRRAGRASDCRMTYNLPQHLQHAATEMEVRPGTAAAAAAGMDRAVRYRLPDGPCLQAEAGGQPLRPSRSVRSQGDRTGASPLQVAPAAPAVSPLSTAAAPEGSVHMHGNAKRRAPDVVRS